MKEKIKKVERILKIAKIIEESDLSSREKFDLIFSDEISHQANIEWYDPDTSYIDDIRYFIRGLEEFIKLHTKND